MTGCFHGEITENRRGPMSHNHLQTTLQYAPSINLKAIALHMVYTEWLETRGISFFTTKIRTSFSFKEVRGTDLSAILDAPLAASIKKEIVAPTLVFEWFTPDARVTPKPSANHEWKRGFRLRLFG